MGVQISSLGQSLQMRLMLFSFIYKSYLSALLIANFFDEKETFSYREKRTMQYIRIW